MSIYCHTTNDGETVEWIFRMGKAPQSVTLPDGRVADRDIAAEHGGFKNTSGNWPMNSDALGCHPNQVKKLSEALAEQGVVTNFTNDGRAVVTSRAHRNALLKARNLGDLDAGYGDRLPPAGEY